MTRSALSFFAFCVLLANGSNLSAAVYLSNLTNRFSDGGLGPIESIPPDWRPATARFTTGSAAFRVNSVTLEFSVGIGNFSWTNATVRISQARGNEIILLGSLKNPTVNPLPTQWPAPSAQFPGLYTTFIDFHPVKDMILQEWSTYIVEISASPISSTGLGLIASSSSNYMSLGCWQMGPSSHPFGGPFFGQPQFFLKLAVDADGVPQPWGYIVPRGITAFERGRVPSPVEVHVIQDPTSGDYTCFSFEPQGRGTFEFNRCLDEGVRAFLVPGNAPISLQAILENKYTELKQREVFQAEVPFYLGFYTGRERIIEGMPGGSSIYTYPVFGWGKFVNQDDALHMVDSGLEYGGAGIYAGTQTLIGEPPVLNFAHYASHLQLWWRMSATELVLQQTSDLASPNWVDATSLPTLNHASFRYEVTIRDSEGRRFYRLASK